MNKELLINEVSSRTGIMPEVTEIVLDTAGEAIGEQARERACPALVTAGGAAALLLTGVIVRKLRRRG